LNSSSTNKLKKGRSKLAYSSQMGAFGDTFETPHIRIIELKVNVSGRSRHKHNQEDDNEYNKTICDGGTGSSK